MNEEKPTRRAAARVCYCMSIRCWRPTVATVATARASVSPSTSPPVVVAAARSLPRPSSAQLSWPCTALKLASKARRNSILSQIMPVVRPRSLLSLSARPRRYVEQQPTRVVLAQLYPDPSRALHVLRTKLGVSVCAKGQAAPFHVRRNGKSMIAHASAHAVGQRRLDWLVGQSDDAGRGNPRALALALSW